MRCTQPCGRAVPWPLASLVEHTTPLDVPGSKPWRLVPFFPRKHRAVRTDETDPVFGQAMQAVSGPPSFVALWGTIDLMIASPTTFLVFLKVKALVEAERVPESSVTCINARCVAEEQLGSVVNVGEFLNQCACVCAWFYACVVCVCVQMCMSTAGCDFTERHKQGRAWHLKWRC